MLILGTELAHKFRVCDLFHVFHGYVVSVDDVECVFAFDTLGDFVGAGPNALVEMAKFIIIRRVPYCS